MIGIIHMNGRLYDPVLRRFLNADENIQDMFNTQNYNKYGYVLNNPLMYNDPSGELFFAFLGVWAFWKAVLIGAAIGLASYTVGLAVTGNMGMWNLGGALRATLFGAVSGAVTFGIGSLFSAAAKTLGNALLQAGAHGVSQGTLGLMQGQSLVSSIIGGVLGSLAASGWDAMLNGMGLGQFSDSVYGMITFSTLSGGVGAELAGGNFWQGAIAAGVVAGLNHAMHHVMNQQNPLSELERQLKNEARQLITHLKEIGEFPYDFIMGTKDFIDTYVEMRKANLKDSDKYFHSKANYKASLRGYGGEFVAEKLSNLREFLDQHYPKFDSRAASMADQEANSYGRSIGVYNRNNWGKSVEYKYAIPFYTKSYFGKH